jgi:SpoVK/Ycf46/Vps4 family AAA+-type ATPase
VGPLRYVSNRLGERCVPPAGKTAGPCEGGSDETTSRTADHAAAALDRGRVDEQKVIEEARTRVREDAHEPLGRVGEAAATLEVAGSARQDREEMAEPLARDREEPAIAGDTHDRLAGAEREHLGVRDPAPRVALMQRVSRSASIVAPRQTVF